MMEVFFEIIYQIPRGWGHKIHEQLIPKELMDISAKVPHFYFYVTHNES